MSEYTAPVKHVHPQHFELTEARDKIKRMIKLLYLDIDNYMFDDESKSDLLEILESRATDIFDELHFGYFWHERDEVWSGYEIIVEFEKRLEARGLMNPLGNRNKSHIKESHLQSIAQDHIDGIDIQDKYPDEFPVICWIDGLAFSFLLSELRNEYPQEDE